MNYQQHITLALSAIDDEIEELRTKRQRLIDAMGWEAAPDDGAGVTVTISATQATVDEINDRVRDAFQSTPAVGAKTAAARARAAERATCPDCGKEMSRMGLGAHRAKSHGYRVGAPAPAPKTPAAAAPLAAVKPASGPKVLACSECDFTADVDDVKKLSAHAITTHKRPPLPAERTPVVAA